MKMIAEYLEHAISFERMAAKEENAELRVAFQKQAANYRDLAAARAKRYGSETREKRRIGRLGWRLLSFGAPGGWYWPK